MALIDWLMGRTPEQEQLEERALGGTSIDTVEIWPGFVVPITEASGAGTYAGRLPAAYRARTMTINTLAQLDVDHRGDSPLVRRPDPDITRGEWLRETISSLIDHGNAYWRLIPSRVQGRPPAVIRVLNPGEMVVTWEGQLRDRRVYTYRQRQLVHGRDVWHLSMARGRDELTGRGPMQHTRLAGVASALDFAQQYFTNGHPSGALKHPSQLTKTEAQALLDQWTEQHSQGTRTPAVLSGGLEWEALGITPKDADWVATHGAGILDVAQIFGIPARLLGYSQPGSSLTYGNVTDVYLSWWRETLQPDYAAVIEEAWGAIAGTRVRFDPTDLLRGDVQSRYETAIQLAGAGFDPAEAMTALGLPALSQAATSRPNVTPNLEAIDA